MFATGFAPLVPDNIENGYRSLKGPAAACSIATCLVCCPVSLLANSATIPDIRLVSLVLASFTNFVCQLPTLNTYTLSRTPHGQYLHFSGEYGLGERSWYLTKRRFHQIDLWCKDSNIWPERSKSVAIFRKDIANSPGEN